MKSLLTNGIPETSLFLWIFGFIFMVLMIYIFHELLELKRDVKQIRKIFGYQHL